MGSLRVLLIQKYRNHKNNRVDFLVGVDGETEGQKGQKVFM